jgi:ketosteroid isomerase-like protein
MTQRILSGSPFAFAALSAALVASTAQASVETDAQAVVTEWVDAFNRGDLKAFAARCAPRAGVLDGFPPFAWTSCADWMSAYESNSKAIKLTDGRLSIGQPVSAFADGNRVYLVYPAKFSDKEDGKPIDYVGTWTITLEKIASRWEITGSGSNWGGDYTVRSKP